MLFKELKKIVCSISYVVFLIFFVIALYSQGALNFENDKVEIPQEGQDYGVKSEEIPEIIMPAALQDLYHEFTSNDFVTYPVGFIKHVKLDVDEQREVAIILSKLTGMSEDIFLEQMENNPNTEGITFDNGNGMLPNHENDHSFTINSQGGFDDKSNLNVSIHSSISYDVFKQQMQKIDNLLGGGSKYDAASLIEYGIVPLTYEEACAQYDLVKQIDNFTGGYARLFSDYAGVMILSIMPVFLAVILCLKDVHSKMQDIIYSRKIASMKFIINRYLALIISVMIPTIILAYISNISTWNMYDGMNIDYLAPLKYSFIWLLPSVMISCAVGMFLTILSETPIAIAVQGLWWFIDINMGIKSITSAYDIVRLSPRHNADSKSFFNVQEFVEHFDRLLTNRLFFVILSIILLALTIMIYNLKRKGKLNGTYHIKKMFTNLSNRYHKSTA